MTKTYDHRDVTILRDALFGRSVVSVERGEFSTDEKSYYRDTAEGKVTLDDGTVLYLAGNEGGCSCGAGDYALTKLNDMPINGITDVQITDELKDGKDYEYGMTYRIFVLAQDNRIELAEFQGDDGNGYYGTGFWFTIKESGD